MLYERVIKATDKALAKNPGAKGFFISLESFHEFITFHLIVKIQFRNELDSGKMSMRQYLQRNATFKKSFDKTVMDDEEEYKLFHSTLRNAVNRYNTLNHKTIEQEQQRKEVEAQVGNKVSRFENTIEIYDFQAEAELPILMGIKERKGSINATYQRVLKNNGHNINFTNYKEFVDNLITEVEESPISEENQMIQKYLIEKNLCYETIKLICKEYEELTAHSLSSLKAITDINQARLELMVYVMKMPMIKQRKKYIEVVKDLPIEKFMAFINEIDSIRNFCTCILLEFFEEYDQIEFKLSDMEVFEAYVNLEDIKNDYKLRTGFSSETFKTVMEQIQKGNKTGIE